MLQAEPPPKRAESGYLAKSAFSCAALDIALSLVTKAGRGGIPLARGGLAWGTVIRAHGDVYGPTVNRSARLCDAATTSSVFLDAAAALAVDSDRVDRVGTISLKGIGRVEAYRALR